MASLARHGNARSWARLLTLTVFLLCCCARAHAQVGSTTDILTGVITGPDGHPLADVAVDATSVETQITRHTTTNSSGRYTIVFPDGGGQYTVTARYLGMAPRTFALVRQADEDRLVANVQLSQTLAVLDTVRVRGRRRPRGRGERQTPGATGRSITGDQASRLPIDASDLNDLAALAPGVIPIAGTDSTDAAFSVAGLPPTANSITVDGLSFGSSSVPQDAIRSTRVITNSYDVARGQFSGGLVATTTRGGTNRPGGSFTYSLRDRDMAFGVDPNSPFARGYTQNQLSGGYGGPLVRNKLFAFGAVQGRRRNDALASLLNANAITLERLGTNADSVARFMDAVQREGLPTAPAGFDADRLNESVSALVRLDYLFADNHTLMLRGDWRWNDQDPSRVGSLALPATGGTQTGHGAGLMATLTSRFGPVINELRAYGADNVRNGQPYIALPEGRVQVASAVSDSARAVSTLTFGGNPGLPQHSDTRMLELSDELSWLPGDASHRIKLGFLLDAQRFSQDVTSNREGTFTFNSLSDFEANLPASFTRTLAPVVRSGTAINPSGYLGDTWRHGRALQLTYGLRVEGSEFQGAPAYNPLVDSLVALRTDRFPSEVHVSPRAGFTWTIGGGSFGAPATVVRGGLGEFRSTIPTGLFSAAQGATGIAGDEQELVCVGDGVPTPDWSAYLGDPSALPTTCAAGGLPVIPEARDALPNVTVFAPDFGASRAWRGSLGLQRRFLSRYSANLNVSWARGENLPRVTDLNLDTTPRFTLQDEGDRPVFVGPQAIVPATGAAQFFASRVHPELAHVAEIGSGLESRSTQVTVGLNGFTLRGLIFQASYTWLRARDQSSFTCCSAVQGLSAPTTAGNPNVAEWAPSSYGRTHSFLLTATYPITAAVELTAIGRMMSGAPFTPMVSTDINGDGLRNDRAFLFDPASTADTGVANAMRRVLAAASPAVRGCLTSQLGTVAGRNSCSGPWQPSLDFQLNVRPNILGLGRRLTLSILTVNMLAGVDQLLHGENNLHGWGGFTRPDPTLLYVRGFDPATNRYRYEVNERFGTTSGPAAAFRSPFQLAVQLRLTAGPDQARDRIRGIFGGGRRGGRGGGGGMNMADFAERFEQLLPNPATQVLALRDTLHLTSAQVAQLTAARDSLDRKNGVLADSIRAAVNAAGSTPNVAQLFSVVRPNLQAARANVQRATDAVQHILTSAQWKHVPGRIKRSAGAGGPGRGRRP